MTTKINKEKSICTCPEDVEYNDSNGSDESNITLETSISNIPDVKDVKFMAKEKFYYNHVDKFFKTNGKKQFKRMVDIIEGNSHISLRIMDWFVTRYAHKKKVSYDLKSNDEDDDIFMPGKRFFSVNIGYKAQLRAYKKKYFDPFRRDEKKKFWYPYEIEKVTHKLFTTIGQLNFFLWAFENEIVDYIENNYDAIIAEMNVSNKHDKVRKIKKKKEIEKKKKEIVKNEQKNVVQLNTVLEFD